MATPTLTLRSVTSGGGLDQFFPDFDSLDLSPVFSAAGAVKFTYPQTGINWNLLHDDLEMAVLLDGIEVTSLRCVIESTEGNDADTAEGGSVWTYTCRTLLGRMDTAVIYPPLWPTSSDPVKHDYVSVTPGRILVDFITAAQSRGTLTWLSIDFSATLDSTGTPWASTIDMSFNVGTKYSDIVKALVDAGVLEVQFNRRTLQAYNADSLGTDKTIGSTPLRFIRGRDMKESPRKSSTRELTTTLLLAGNNNLHVERQSAPGTLSLWGRREAYLSLNNLETAGSLSVVGDEVLSTSDSPLLEVTHGLVFEVPENPQPITDFDVGDWAYSDVGRGLELHRIKQWVLSVSKDGKIEGSVTLNDLIAEQLTKVNRRLASLENGTTNAGPSEEVDDGKAPAIPTDINLISSYYPQMNRARALVTMTWDAVTTNADATPASDIEGYTAQWRYATDGFWRNRASTSGTTLTFDGMDTATPVVLQVEAHDKYGRSSGYSADQPITTAGDTTPPPKPSAPVVTTNVGTLRVVWTGLDNTSNPQPTDFAGVEVHLGPNGTFTPDSSTLKDFLPAGTLATTITQGLSYGTEYFARLVSVDTSGNRSAASDLTSTSHIILTPVVNVEIGTGQVGLANTRFSDVGNLIDDGSFEDSGVRDARSILFSGSHFAWDNTTSSNGTWSLRHDSWAGGATSEQLLLQGSLPVKPGERVFGAADYRCESSVPGTSYLTLAIKWKDKSGAYLDSTGAVNNVSYTLSDNQFTTSDNLWHSRVTGISKVAPSNVATMEIWLITANRTAGKIWIDAVEIRRQIDTLLVADLAVTTAKIADLAVNNAKIADLAVGKLTTGTLGADIVVGARIKTADTGARVEINSGGIGAWDASSNQTVTIASADGSVSIIGQLKSGTSGKRIEINPTATMLPEIRFYPNTGSNYSFINSFSSGTDSLLGMNGGQFTGAGGTTVASRVLLSNIGANLHVIRTDTQAQHGGGIAASASGIAASYYVNGQRGGYWDTTSTYAQFGYDDASASNRGNIYFGNDSTITMTGKFPNYSVISSTSALFTGVVSVAGGGGVVLSYGATMATTMAPMGMVLDSGALMSYQVTASSPTGYTALFSRTASGGAYWSIFAYRC